MTLPVPLEVPPPPAGLVARLRAAGVVHAEEEAGLIADAASNGGGDLAVLTARRCGGEPLEVVVGWALFDGIRVPVRPGVFVPRRRTEALLRTADRSDLTSEVRPVCVVDLCCGTGAVGVALARRLRARRLDVQLLLSDLDDDAAACAAHVLTATGTSGSVVRGDLFSSLPPALQGGVDVLLANVPYVPTGDLPLLPPEARDHEPVLALDGGDDGLDVLRRVLAGAPTWLAPGGTVHTEVAAGQVAAALAAARAAGLGAEVVADRDRDALVVVGARDG